MTYSSSIIANFFIQKDYKLKDNPMKLLKLVYISHGFYLAFTEKPLITEEIQAWQYGPVIPELYFRIKTDNLNVHEFHHDYERFLKDTETNNLLEAIYDKYGKYTAMELSNMTHQKDSPWDITIHQFKSKIDNQIIKEHYRKLLGYEN